MAKLKASGSSSLYPTYGVSTVKIYSKVWAILRKIHISPRWGCPLEHRCFFFSELRLGQKLSEKPEILWKTGYEVDRNCPNYSIIQEKFLIYCS